MSDIAHLLPRCPRCGFGLRMVRGIWWCDTCKVTFVPQGGPSLRDAFRAAGEKLRQLLAPSRRRATLTYPRSAYSVADRGPALARCPACGSLTPRDVPSCVHCGTLFGRPPEIPPTQRPVPSPPRREELVYQYIVERGGELSLSKASVELGMGLPELRDSIQALERSGKIMRDTGREER